MQTYGALFAHEFERVVETKIEFLRSVLENPLTERDKLPFVQGQIAALREVVGPMMEEAAEAAKQENR